jgi:hypothetical protein
MDTDRCQVQNASGTDTLRKKFSFIQIMLLRGVIWELATIVSMITEKQLLRFSAQQTSVRFITTAQLSRMSGG